jgi:hypothetical protein
MLNPGTVFARYSLTCLIHLYEGGPGGSGMQLALGRTNMLKSYIGGSHDLIGFDPRGIGMTTCVLFLSFLRVILKII